MRLIYLPANMVWCFIFGRPETASIEAMGDYGRFFRTRKEAVNAAANCGLSVASDGTVKSRKLHI